MNGSSKDTFNRKGQPQPNVRS